VTNSNRRRKAGSLPAILVNENERQKLQTRSYRSFGSVEEARENAKACSPVTYRPPYHDPGPRGRCSVRSPPDGDTEPEEPGQANSNERVKPNGSENVEELDGRRRSLPVVPEEGLNTAPPGRQMSDPLVQLTHSTDTRLSDDESTQLSVALDSLATLRNAVSGFLHTHTGQNPTTDVEVIQMLELLSAALVKDG